MAAVRMIRGNHNRRRSRAAEEEALGESGQHGSQAFGHQIPRTETANFFYASHSPAPSHGRPRTMRGLPEAEVKGEPFRVGGTTLPGWSESSSSGAQGTPSQGTPSREARRYLCASPGGYPGGYPGGAQTLPPLMIQGEGGGSSSFHHHHDRGDSQRLLLSAALLGGPLSGVAAHFHCHAPTCLTQEMRFDGPEGELICREDSYHGKGATPGDRFGEKGYIAQPVCMWGNPPFAPPPLVSGRTLWYKAVTNNTYGHHGEMALPQMLLASIPNGV